ncbi:MAG: ROK family protein, partial [Acidimicrobiia bacterium]|nr:ROK family protein [Acidimicrobiia bacterium]
MRTLTHTTNQDVRRSNRARVLRHVVTASETTRAELAAACRLSTATVGNVVSDLIDEGVLEEAGLVPSRGGRPIARLALRPAGGRLIGADVGEQRVTVEVFDLALNKLDAESVDVSPYVAQPETVGSALNQAITIVRDRKRTANTPILGIGLGVPGTVETENGTTTIFAGSLSWGPTDLARLSGGLDLPVFADNGARVHATAESLFGAAKGASHGIVALIGHGIGAGILVNGKLLRGSVNGAGEWGHTKVTVDGRSCACGSLGCLEAHVGGAAIVRRWLEIGGEPAPTEEESLAQLIKAADAGDPAAGSVVDKTVRLLGVGLANLINLFNPATIIIGGWAGLQLLAARR